MALTKEQLEKEIVASKAAIIAMQSGMEIHKIVLKAFEEELKTFK